VSSLIMSKHPIHMHSGAYKSSKFFFQRLCFKSIGHCKYLRSIMYPCCRAAVINKNSLSPTLSNEKSSSPSYFLFTFETGFIWNTGESFHNLICWSFVYFHWMYLIEYMCCVGDGPAVLAHGRLSAVPS